MLSGPLRVFEVRLVFAVTNVFSSVLSSGSPRSFTPTETAHIDNMTGIRLISSDNECVFKVVWDRIWVRMFVSSRIGPVYTC